MRAKITYDIKTSTFTIHNGIGIFDIAKEELIKAVEQAVDANNKDYLTNLSEEIKK